METVVRVKRSLRTPIRRLTGCVTGVKERKLCAKRRNRRGGGGGCKTPRLRTAQAKDATVIRSYQEDLEKERQVLL